MERVPTNPVVDRTSIGSVLLQLGVVTMERLKMAISTATGEQALGAILVSMQLISEDDLEAALRVQEAMRKGDDIAAWQEILDFQQQRTQRSIERQDAVCDTIDGLLADGTQTHD